MIKTVFFALAIGVTLVSVVPYIRDIIKGKTKPNIVSWMTWSLLTGIAAAAQLSAHEYVAAIFSAAATLETGTVVVLGLRFGFVKYTLLDVLCQFGAVIGIIVWQVFDAAFLGVLSAVAIDLVGAIPTLRHSWQKPHEETWLTFALGSLGGALELLALNHYNWVTLPYTVYIVVINAVTVAIILTRLSPEGLIKDSV